MILDLCERFLGRQTGQTQRGGQLLGIAATSNGNLFTNRLV